MGKESSEDEEVRQMLDRIEDELTCPICTDLFAAAHLANPCGHSCCGSCLQSWISKNKRKPSCPVCRSILDLYAPMIPNFSVDSAVARHVDELALQGIEEWEAGGLNRLAWDKRKEAWKLDSIKAASRTKIKRLNTSYAVDEWLVPDDYLTYEDELEEAYEDELY